jgi:ubiquitin related modifier 1
MSTSTLSIDVEFGGGLELLFSNQRRHCLTIPTTVPVDNSTSEHTEKSADVTYLIRYLRDNLLKERTELFVEGDIV